MWGTCLNYIVFYSSIIEICKCKLANYYIRIIISTIKKKYIRNIKKKFKRMSRIDGTFLSFTKALYIKCTYRQDYRKLDRANWALGQRIELAIVGEIRSCLVNRHLRLRELDIIQASCTIYFYCYCTGNDRSALTFQHNNVVVIIMYPNSVTWIIIYITHKSVISNFL